MRLFDRLSPSIGEDAAKIIQEAYDGYLSKRSPVLTGFLQEERWRLVKEAIAEDSKVICRAYGGFRGSSRLRIAFAQADFSWDGFDPGISFLCIRGTDAEPDELLSYMKAAGVAEQGIGDIFRSGGDMCAAATKEAAQKLSQRGIDVRGIPKAAEIADAAEILLPGQQAKQVRATVNSMRLDAVSACGFPASRTRLAAEIEIGRAKLNGVTVTDPSAKVKSGDSIVIRSRGRLVVDEIGAITKKGRISIHLSRFSPI